MPEKCKSCDKDIGQSKDCIKCGVYNGSFHATCVSATSGDLSKKATLRNNWKCGVCAPQSSSRGESESVQESAVLEAVAAFRSNPTLARLNLDRMQLDITNVAKDVSELKNQIADIRGKYDRNLSDVKELSAENKELKLEMTVLQLELSELQQHIRKKNIIIAVVPQCKGENMSAILDTLANKLNIHFERYDVGAVHRVPAGKDDTRPPSILVAFLSRAIKLNWILVKRTMKSLSARDLGAAWPDHQVYVNEHLTLQTRAVFNEARRLVKTGKLAAVWTAGW